MVSDYAYWSGDARIYSVPIPFAFGAAEKLEEDELTQISQTIADDTMVDQPKDSKSGLSSFLADSLPTFDLGCMPYPDSSSENDDKLSPSKVKYSVDKESHERRGSSQGKSECLFAFHGKYSPILGMWFVLPCYVVCVFNREVALLTYKTRLSISTLYLVITSPLGDDSVQWALSRGGTIWVHGQREGWRRLYLEY